ncbi:hypothetical protein [Halorubrum sp. DTA98]|uniref:hypothetical protein n=1 Tax=Halorubrum sp. DTA98 TaxID=3402163 RepID=UPI003AB108D9
MESGPPPTDPRAPSGRDVGSDRGIAIALIALIQPTFLGPAVAMALVGGALAPTLDPWVLGLHAGAVGLAVYVAHLRDAFVDRFVRREEPAGGTTPDTLRTALLVVSIAFLAVVSALWTATGPIAAVVTVPLWVLAIAHAPYFDTGPVGVTVDYAVGVAIALLGAYVLQTGRLSAGIVGTAVVYLIVLSAVKVSVDGLDHAFDRSIGKRTVPVAIGPANADRFAAVSFALAGVVTVVLAAGGALPIRSAIASVVLGLAAAAVFVRPRRRAVRLQIACVYPFSALFLGSLCVDANAVCGTGIAWLLPSLV